MFILSTMHLIKMVRLHHEQPFPSFSSAQRTKAFRGSSETSGIFHFAVFSEIIEFPENVVFGFFVFFWFFLKICVKLVRTECVRRGGSCFGTNRFA